MGDAEGPLEGCIICRDPMDTTGAHQVASLACGHLFGRHCIEKWLKSMAKSQGSCPHCCAKAKLSEIRPIVISVSGAMSPRDTSASEEIRRELARERLERSAAEAEAARYKLRAEALQRQVDLMANAKPPFPDVVVGGAKCLAWLDGERLILGSGQGTAFALSMITPNSSNFAQTSKPIHSGVIRDVAVSEEFIATASLDGSCKILSLASLEQIQSFDVGEPVWSVLLDGHIVHVGTTKGRVVSTDVRRPKDLLNDGQVFSKASPIHSLASARDAEGAILAASFAALWRLSRDGGSPQRVANLDGNISSMVGGEASVALSLRGPNPSVHVGHVSSNAVWTSTIPPCAGHSNSKALLSPGLRDESEQPMVAIGHEATNGTVALWKASSRPLQIRAGSNQAVVTQVRFCPLDRNILATLSADSTLSIVNTSASTYTTV